MLPLSRGACRASDYVVQRGKSFALECEPGAVVRVRIRGNVVRVRVNETAIRIRVVVRTANDTAPGTLYLLLLMLSVFVVTFLLLLFLWCHPGFLASAGGGYHCYAAFTNSIGPLKASREPSPVYEYAETLSALE